MEWLANLNWDTLGPQIGLVIGTALLILGDRHRSHAKRYAARAETVVRLVLALNPNLKLAQVIESALVKIEETLGTEAAKAMQGYVEAAARQAING